MSEFTVKITVPELVEALNNLARAIKGDGLSDKPKVNIEGKECTVISTAEAIPAAAPPETAVPTAAAPTYTLDMLARAGTSLIDTGKMNELMGVLAKFNVSALTELPKEQYGLMANSLRALGAVI